MRALTDADADRHAAEIDDGGYTIVEQRGLTPADNGFEGRDTYRVYNLLAHGEVFQRIPTAPAVLPVVCNSMWAITDFTEANGATRLVPGSHKDPEYPAYGESYDTIPAEMPAGSVLLWHGSLWHGG
jgi:Phytanoyl-CoA dioxygenase (PhyH)